MAQVTINLDNYKITPPHIAFEECKKDALDLNVGVCGSELVGLIPIEAMLMAADYYIEKENLFLIDEKQKINLVIDRLGLSSVSPFIPEKRIIEYMIKEAKSEPLASSTVRQFVEEVGSRSSAPGGGSVAALAASLGAGLSVMVAWLTYGVRKFEKYDEIMRKVIEPLDKKMREMIPMIDADTDAFNDYMTAMKMPKDTDKEMKLRNDKMQEGLKKAIEVPMTVMRKADECWEYVGEIAKYGNMNSKSDLQVGAKSLETGIWGAFKNVEINVKDIEDKSYSQKVMKEGYDILARAEKNVEEVCRVLEEREAKED
jgi:glutamate formiminotransferase/formiminotetrahydrofolate cyclodeaminase